MEIRETLAGVTGALAAAAGDIAALDLWRRYRANQAELYAAISLSWPARSEDGDDDPIEDRAGPLDAAESDLARAIEGLDSAGPIAIAAKINVAFDHARRTDDIEDLPWCMLASVLRTILPGLPADMAAALQPLAAGRRETLLAKLYGQAAL